jgi:hypothetical protein
LDCNLRAHSSPKGKVNKRDYSENQPCTKLNMNIHLKKSRQRSSKISQFKPLSSFAVVAAFTNTVDNPPLLLRQQKYPT